ncbi:MAG: HAD family hydrolase [Chloroflexota bacterium]|nr:MAG: hypothetical protein DIU68_20695 [Chloroflexota bacterium]
MTDNNRTYADIRLIVLDIDGTLLNSQLELSERNERALRAALEAGVQISLATGKTASAGAKLVERLGLSSPNIYLQGTAIFEADGSIRYQQTLDPAVARQVITYIEDRGFELIAYSGTRMMVPRVNQEVIDGIMRYHEPMPEVVGPIQNLLDNIALNKLMIVGPGPREIKALRWQLQAQLDGRCRLMQAGIPEMVEVLPPGASKGAALRIMLRNMGINPANVMAMGDAENDIEMLQVAGLGVAVGNASEALKAAADEVVAPNDDDGVAEAIERFVLKRSLEEPKPEVAPQAVETAAENEEQP